MIQKKICLVGYGNHAKNRIFPAIKNSNAKLVAIVSKKNIKHLHSIKHYKYLGNALNYLEKDVIIFLCTPPRIHENQILLCLKKSFNVICEKPIFLNPKKLNLSRYLIQKSNNFLFENYMYLYSRSFNFFKFYLSKNFNKIKKISFIFHIPNFSSNSFRDFENDTDNIIYDIACYPISALNNLFPKITLNDFSNIKLIKKSNKNIVFNLNYQKIIISISIGFNLKYRNESILHLGNKLDKKINFNYFFHGLDIPKSIRFFKSNKIIKVKNYCDINSFEKIFNLSNSSLRKNSNKYGYFNKNLKFLIKTLSLVDSSN